MYTTKVSVLQKAPGSVELIVGQNSILVNCAILMKLLSTKTEFSMYNAMLEECNFSIKSNVCTIKLGNQTGQVFRGEFLRAISPFEVIMANKDQIFVELNKGEAISVPSTPVIVKAKEEWERSLNNEY